MEKAPDLTDLTSIKKLKGHDAAYRIRLGDYRLGFFLSGQTIELARFVHRKDIYKVFP